VPLLLIALLIFFGLFAIVVLTLPLSLIQRYRTGTARRSARTWLPTINLVAFSLSSAIFLGIAAFSSLWIPRAFLFSFVGILAGGLIGFAGLALTRWETTPYSLHYTPNRWLVLSLMLVVAARLLYGIWRAWTAWRITPEDASWIAASGAAGSLGAGAVVLGYYLVYWTGVRRRGIRHRELTTPRRR
jgi:hypothetical protein